MESNTGMRAYVQMEYTADGLSPAEVERFVTRAASAARVSIMSWKETWWSG